MFNIALNTFREIVRNKFLYMILFFAFIFIIFSIILGTLTLGDEKKLIVDFGLSMIEIFGILGVLFVGSQLLFKEIEGKTIFLIFSKPIKRSDFLLGKFLGFSLTIFLIILFQAIVFLLLLLFKEIEITKLIVFSIFFIFLKLELFLSLVLFFSSFMSNMTTILVSVLFYLIGNSFSLLIDMVLRTKNQIFIYFGKFLELLFPPFEALNLKDYIGSFSLFSNKFFIYNTFYSFVYLALILFFTVLIFNRKKFEN